MFYRRKILLALLQSFGGQLEKIALQKLLFLLTNKQKESAYSFIPFHYGSYSISANADLTAMVSSGLLSENTNAFCKTDKTNYIDKLTVDDQNILTYIRENFKNLDSEALMKYTYLNFHYYAINSKIAKDILSKKEYENILTARPTNNKSVLFTIGYEGISLEDYLNRLIENDVKVLVDVRSNPVSRKFGFSDKSLRLYCGKVGVEYIHIPEVGIRSEYRKNLNIQSDYNKLFKKYREVDLKQTESYQQEILNLLKNKRRIALTCFELDTLKCHRTYLAESIIRLSQGKFELKHI